MDSCAHDYRSYSRYTLTWVCFTMTLLFINGLALFFNLQKYNAEVANPSTTLRTEWTANFPAVALRVSPSRTPEKLSLFSNASSCTRMGGSGTCSAVDSPDPLRPSDGYVHFSKFAKSESDGYEISIDLVQWLGAWEGNECVKVVAVPYVMSIRPPTVAEAQELNYNDPTRYVTVCNGSSLWLFLKSSAFQNLDSPQDTLFTFSVFVRDDIKWPTYPWNILLHLDSGNMDFQVLWNRQKVGYDGFSVLKDSMTVAVFTGVVFGLIARLLNRYFDRSSSQHSDASFLSS